MDWVPADTELPLSVFSMHMSGKQSGAELPHSKLGAGEGGGARSFKKLACVRTDITVAEDGVARDEKFGSGFHDLAHGVEIDSSIHFNAEMEVAFGSHAGERSNLV